MRLSTKARLWQRMGTLNSFLVEQQRQLDGHHDLLDTILGDQLEIVDVVTKNSELAKRLAEFSVDMAGLLVDLMSDVKELADLTGYPEIGERINARADIASAMLKLRNEAQNG